MAEKKPTFYIHAGSHKTGSTSIQHFFHQHEDFIERANAFYLPKKICKHPKTFRHNSNKLFSVEKNFDKLLNELQEHRGKNFFITDEEFRNIDASAIGRFREIFPEYDVKIIFYVRKYDAYVRSLFNERTKVGQRWGIKYTNYDSFLDNFFPTNQYSPELRIQIYENAVGRENLLIKIYDRAHLINGDVVDDILDIMGIIVPKDIQSVNVNTRISTDIIPCLSVFASSLKDENYNENSYKTYNNVKSLLKNTHDTIQPSSAECIAKHRNNIHNAIDIIDSYVEGYKNLCSQDAMDIDEREIAFNKESLYIMNLIFDFYRKSNEHFIEQAQKISLMQKQLDIISQQVSPLLAKKSILQKIQNIILQPFLKKKAFALVNSKQFPEAEAIAQSITVNNPQIAWTYYILGKCQWQQGKQKEALENLDRAIALEPQAIYFQTFKNSCLEKLNKKK